VGDFVAGDAIRRVGDGFGGVTVVDSLPEDGMDEEGTADPDIMDG